MNSLFRLIPALFLTFFAATAQQFTPGQRVDASVTMNDSGWEKGCTFVSGPHAENNGYNRVKCGNDTYWTATKWIRTSTAAAPVPESAKPAAQEVRSTARATSTVPAQKVAERSPCVPGSYANCAPPASAATTAARLTPGKYSCYAGGQYTFMDIAIKSASTYADSGGDLGTYTFDAATQKVNFTSGSLKGKNSKLLPGNTIGLTTTQGSFFSTTCQLEK